MTGDEAKEIVEALRAHHKKENEYINQRLQWFMASQSFLFTAIAITWDKEANMLVFFICLVGMLISASVGVVTYRAGKEIGAIQDYWKENITDDLYKGPSIVMSDIAKGPLQFLIPAYLPNWFVGIWVVVLLSVFWGDITLLFDAA